MPSVLPALAALAFGCICLPAQLSWQERAAAWQAEDISLHLAADDVVEVAWAGHRARETEARTTIPALRTALARLADADTQHGRMARAQLLDALIHFHVKLPAEELLPHAEGSLRGATMVLAFAAAAANEDYFVQRFAARGGDTEWETCGEWLASVRHRDVVAQSLERFTFRLRIVVSDGFHPGFR